MGNTCFVRISKVGMLSSQHLELQLFYSLVSEGHNQLETKKKGNCLFKGSSKSLRKDLGFLSWKQRGRRGQFVCNQSQSNHLQHLFLNGLQNLFGCSGHKVSPFFFHERPLKGNSCWSSHRFDLTNTRDGQEAEYSSVGCTFWGLFLVDSTPRSWANPCLLLRDWPR